VPKGRQEKQTALHREDHRHAGTRRRSAAATPHTVRQNESTKSEPFAGCLAVATMITQHAGASPHPPLDSTLVASQKTPRRRHRRASPHPPQYAIPQICLLNRCQDDEQCRPNSQDPHQTLEPRLLADSISLHHPRTQPPPTYQQVKLSLAPSFDDVPHWSRRARQSNPL
jgi:hypothetical protein